MIGGYIGEPIGGIIPFNTIHEQQVNIVATATLTQQPKTIGKLVSIRASATMRPIARTTLDITSRFVLHDPTDYILAGQQLYDSVHRTWSMFPRNEKREPKTMRSGVRNISGGKPTFTVKTGGKK